MDYLPCWFSDWKQGHSAARVMYWRCLGLTFKIVGLLPSKANISGCWCLLHLDKCHSTCQDNVLTIYKGGLIILGIIFWSGLGIIFGFLLLCFSCFSCFSAFLLFLLFLLLCFSAFLLFCFSCFSPFLLFCFSASLLLCFSAFLLFCFSCFFASLLFLLLCFSAFPASLPFCCFAFVRFLFLCFSAFFCFACFKYLIFM